MNTAEQLPELADIGHDTNRAAILSTPVIISYRYSVGNGLRSGKPF
jgi:hypothetical protein